MAPTDDGSATAVSRPPWEILCVAALVAYFLARLLYFAVAIAPEVPPDESTHLGIVRLHANTALLIDDSPESYRFGLVTRQPNLYHFALGKLAALNVFGMDDVLYLRLINVIFAVIGVATGYRLISRLTGNPLMRIAFVVMITNTLMFTFIGAAVSYDNLVNLLAVLSVSSFISFIRTEKTSRLLLFVLWNSLGTLTKTTFLPLTVVLVALLIVERRGRILDDLASLGGLIRKPTWPHIALAGVAVLAFGASLWLYGSNLIRYGRPVPRCTQVLELEQCMENRVFARNRIVSQYRDDELTLDEAIKATTRIRHPGDRDHAIRLLQNEQAYKYSKPRALPRWDYIQVVWVQAMKPTIFGIQAHLSILKDPWALLPYNLVLFAAFVLSIRGVGWSRVERPWTYLAVIAAFYFLFLIGYVNYGYYVSSHAPFLGVQGRYLFPVLIPAYIVAARFLLEPFRRWAQIAILVTIIIVFVQGDLPFFLRHAGPDWFVNARTAGQPTTLTLPSH